MCLPWKVGSSATNLALSIGQPEVHVWAVRLAASMTCIQELYKICSADEKTKANSFRYEDHMSRYVIGHGVLRVILNRYVRQCPTRLLFRYGPKGKPVLETRNAPILHFNLSHSENCVLYAMTHEAELGVDVERVRELADEQTIAQEFFSSEECKDLRTVDAGRRYEGFFNCWTCKEAYVKALGDGLSAPLDSFRVSLKPGQTAEFLKLDRDRYHGICRVCIT
jgi:4'-phosphopantetheinyl transferase